MEYPNMMLALLGTPELILIGVVAVLVFGNRLPDVGRSLGKGIVEFKKGLRGVEDEIDEASKKDSSTNKPAAS
jgi:sec-independent protein translocase protein TatA